jgi:hypothetical protein
MARRELQSVISNLDALRVRLSSAVDRVAQGRSGAHQRSVLINLLVVSLSRIFEDFTRKRISRSQKGGNTSIDFISAVFRVADPSVGASSIDEATKHLIKSRGGIGSRTGA